jgi:hypothetical protein
MASGVVCLVKDMVYLRDNRYHSVKCSEDNWTKTLRITTAVW